MSGLRDDGALRLEIVESVSESHAWPVFGPLDGDDADTSELRLCFETEGELGSGSGTTPSSHMLHPRSRRTSWCAGLKESAC